MFLTNRRMTDQTDGVIPPSVGIPNQTPHQLEQIIYRTSHPSKPFNATSSHHHYKIAIIAFLSRFFRSSAANNAAMSAAKTKAQSIIDDNAVAVFSKSYCPYCRASKTLLSEMGAKFYVIEMDQVDDGADIQNALEEISGQRSVPNIYIQQKHIGGNSDLQAKKGDLPTLLKDAGAV
ncbi:MAG: hypothetical protein Q9170_006446 [Blastenia crenularia]